MKIREVKSRADLYQDVTWQVESISRRREGGFRCELEVTGTSAYDHRITLHAAAPLDWEHAYTWAELQEYPLWVGGVKVARPDLRAVRKPRPVKLQMVESVGAYKEGEGIEPFRLEVL